MKHPHFSHMVISGLGLLGGSLGIAAKKSRICDQVIGVARRRVSLDRARALGCIDQGTLHLETAVRGADLVVLAGPVGTSPEWMRRISPHLAPGCLVTDVGSTKQGVVEAIEKFLYPRERKEKNQRTPPAFDFVGSHPMAGSEKSGIDAARSDLFAGATCLLTRTPHTRPEALKRTELFWRAVGCTHTLVLTPAEHDRMAAAASHLPHAVAVCLANVVAEAVAHDERTRDVLASGFRDTARVAAGLPELWQEIFISNRARLLPFLRRMTRELRGLQRALGQSNSAEVKTILERAASFMRSGGR
jgi:prephenate dehydrogenase